MKYGFVEGKNGFNCVSCGTHRGGRACGMSFAKTRTPPEQLLKLEAGLGGALRAPVTCDLFYRAMIRPLT